MKGKFVQNSAEILHTIDKCPLYERKQFNLGWKDQRNFSKNASIENRFHCQQVMKALIFRLSKERAGSVDLSEVFNLAKKKFIDLFGAQKLSS